MLKVSPKTFPLATSAVQPTLIGDLLEGFYLSE